MYHTPYAGFIEFCLRDNCGVTAKVSDAKTGGKNTTRYSEDQTIRSQQSQSNS